MTGALPFLIFYHKYGSDLNNKTAVYNPVDDQCTHTWIFFKNIVENPACL